MIINCGTMGLDWERASLSDYLESLEAWHERHDDKTSHAAEPSDWLRNRVNPAVN